MRGRCSPPGSLATFLRRAVPVRRRVRWGRHSVRRILPTPLMWQTCGRRLRMLQMLHVRYGSAPHGPMRHCAFRGALPVATASINMLPSRRRPAPRLLLPLPP